MCVKQKSCGIVVLVSEFSNFIFNFVEVLLHFISKT